MRKHFSCIYPGVTTDFFFFGLFHITDTQHELLLEGWTAFYDLGRRLYKLTQVQQALEREHKPDSEGRGCSPGGRKSAGLSFGRFSCFCLSPFELGTTVTNFYTMCTAQALANSCVEPGVIFSCIIDQMEPSATRILCTCIGLAIIPFSPQPVVPAS